jgi:valyl-tRNA synthetase
MTIDKTFDPAAIEARWYRHWEESGAFRPARPDAEPYTIVIPPPNVTGSLHIGHALDNTLQDVLIRFERLRGKDALWVVGTDHAGIATQMVVERLLDGEGVKRTDLGREAFEERVWAWKRESGGQITRQLRRLGASCDWGNERFTMDEGFSAIVRRVFVELYRRGLIYRDKRLVNWDPKLKTAISDLEVETREVAGTLTHFRYELVEPVLVSAEDWAWRPERDGTSADGAGTGAGTVAASEAASSDAPADSGETDEPTRPVVPGWHVQPDGSVLVTHITVATTRPETMLGDTGIAVNPADQRYAALVGRTVRHPFDGREIPIVADDWADPAFGSGAVKMTPAHDFNDFEVGKRHSLPLLNIFDADAKINGNPPERYQGLNRFEARKQVVSDLIELGLVERIEDRTIQMPFGDRSGVVIEPWLTDQWYVNAEELAKAPIAAVRGGETKFVPQTWEKTFFQWMENIQPWCISRQLWWGHRIPAAYGPVLNAEGGWTLGGQFAVKQWSHNWNEHFFVGTDEQIAAQARDYYQGVLSGAVHFVEDRIEQINLLSEQSREGREDIVLRRDPDVLDTWFSSALWPFGTLLPNSPDAAALLDNHQHNAALAKHYPTSTLVTGFDIIFFWVARMQMMGHAIIGERPFSTVYCHGLVRDAQGQKMSKSRGNTVDPLGLIEKYGADALRFTLAAMETQGRDIKLSEPRIEGYRNFATKLWNAARFAQGQGIGGSDCAAPPPATHPVNRWIVAETRAMVHAVTAALEAFRFDEAAAALYAHTWNRYCDWYLELIKPVLSGPDGAPPPDPAVAAETRAVAGWALDQILVTLHPFMPFITEELWHALAPRGHDLVLARWATGAPLDPADDAAAEVSWLIDAVTKIRSARNELNVPPSAVVETLAFASDLDGAPAIERNREALRRLARIDVAPAPTIPASGKGTLSDTGELEAALRALGSTIQVDTARAIFALRLGGVVDLAAERARLTKARDAAAKEAASLSQRLANPGFLAKASAEAIEDARTKLAAREAEADRLGAAITRLG